MLLRREGATVHELRTATDMSSVVIHGVLSRLNFDCGFDIRGFTARQHTTGRPPKRYKIVGRAKWHGGYRSFIEGGE